MVYCDNRRCRHHRKGACLNMRLVVTGERCVCFEHVRTQRHIKETNLNHKPVKHPKRNRVLK